MKNLIVLIFLLFATVAVAQNEPSLAVIDSAQVVLRGEESPVYLIVGYSDAYIDSLIRDCGADEVELDDLYTALDDYGWYMSECSMLLDSLGWNSREVDSDIDIYVADEQRHYRMPSRGFVGVAIYRKGEPLEFVDLLDFLSRIWNAE